MKKSIPFEQHHSEFLRDPARAKAYIEVALEEQEKDADTEAFLLAIRDVAEAQGGLGKLAEKTNLHRGNIYKALSKEGNPRLDTVEKILRELGFQLWIKPLKVETEAIPT